MATTSYSTRQALKGQLLSLMKALWPGPGQDDRRVMDYAWQMNKNNLTARAIQVAVVDGALTLMGLVLLGLGAWAVWDRESALAGIALTAGLVLLFAATIHRFESLKGLGIEAKTRELRQTINKAEVAVDQLRDLAELVGANMLRLISSTGRIGSSAGPVESYRVSREVRRILESLGSDPKTIRMALEKWAWYSAVDLYLARLDQVWGYLGERYRQLNQEAAQLQGVQAQELMRRSAAAFGYRKTATTGMNDWSLPEFPAKLKRMLDEAPELLPEQRAALLPSFDEAGKHLTYLVENLDFDDLAYWQRQIEKER